MLVAYLNQSVDKSFGGTQLNQAKNLAVFSFEKAVFCLNYKY